MPPAELILHCGDVTFWAEWSDSWYEPDGANIRSRGYHLKGRHGVALRFDDESDLLEGMGVLTPKVAGTTRRMPQLQSATVAPGQRLRLIPDPQNRYDPNAVEVWDAERRLMIGYIPAECAPRIASARRPYLAWSLWEYRAKESGERVGLRIVTGPELRVEVGGP